MPFDATGRAEQAISFSFDDYLEFIDTVARKLRPGKRGAIVQTVPMILVRLQIDLEAFIAHAVGRPQPLAAHAARRQAKYLWGMAAARAVCKQRVA